MCGRYKLETPWELLYALYKLSNSLNSMPRYNIAPTTPVIAVRPGAAGREAVQLRWGLLPGWIKDIKTAPMLNNARDDSVLEKASFRRAFAARRCLIPADGYYEWQKSGKDKLPWLYEVDNGAVFSIAGLWEGWKSPAGDVIETCAMITTRPNQLAAEVHDRMPVILPEAEYEAWLNPATPVAVAHAMLGPFPAERMRARRVSTKVNNVRYQDPDVLEAPVENFI
jgi:putative SOS response-associated peptidase YedK